MTSASWEDHLKNPTDRRRKSSSEQTNNNRASKLLQWVDKINGIEGAHVVVDANDPKAQLEKPESASQPSAEVVNNIQATDEDTCFKAAQLITETLLMLFAASLLVIAVIVIFSRKTPAFMDSFEQVPKFLFILCCFTAICSFLSWIYSRCRRKLINGENQVNQAIRSSTSDGKSKDIDNNSADASKMVVRDSTTCVFEEPRSQSQAVVTSLTTISPDEPSTAQSNVTRSRNSISIHQYNTEIISEEEEECN